MQTVRSPICQQNASVALRVYSTALPTFILFYFFCSHMHSCNVLMHPLVPPVCAHHCTVIFSYEGRDRGGHVSVFGVKQIGRKCVREVMTRCLCYFKC